MLAATGVLPADLGFKLGSAYLAATAYYLKMVPQN
jgi:hypothetical protein